jgi:hypothetical protein
MSLEEQFISFSEKEIRATQIALREAISKGKLNDLTEEALSVLEKLAQTEARGC